MDPFIPSWQENFPQLSTPFVQSRALLHQHANNAKKNSIDDHLVEEKCKELAIIQEEVNTVRESMERSPAHIILASLPPEGKKRFQEGKIDYAIATLYAYRGQSNDKAERAYYQENIESWKERLKEKTNWSLQQLLNKTEILQNRLAHVAPAITTNVSSFSQDFAPVYKDPSPVHSPGSLSSAHQRGTHKEDVELPEALSLSVKTSYRHPPSARSLSVSLSQCESSTEGIQPGSKQSIYLASNTSLGRGEKHGKSTHLYPMRKPSEQTCLPPDTIILRQGTILIKQKNLKK